MPSVCFRIGQRRWYVVRHVGQQVDLGLLEHGPHADARVVAQHQPHVADHLGGPLDQIVVVAHAVVQREHLPHEEPHRVAHRVEAVALDVAPDPDRVDLHLAHLRQVVRPHRLVRLAHPLAGDVPHAPQEHPHAVEPPLPRGLVAHHLADPDDLVGRIVPDDDRGPIQVWLAEVPCPPQPGGVERQHGLMRRPTRLELDAPAPLPGRTVEGVGRDREPKLGRHRVVGRVVDDYLGADQRRAVGTVQAVTIAIGPHPDLREHLDVLDVHGRPSDQVDVIPDPAGVPVGAERRHRAGAVHRVDHVALDLGDRLGLVGPKRRRQRSVGAADLDLDVLGRVTRCRVLDDEDVGTVEVDAVGHVELERVEHALVRSEVLAVQPDVGRVVHGTEPDEQPPADELRRHRERAAEPDRAEEVPDLGAVPVRRELHPWPRAHVEVRLVVPEQLPGLVAFQPVAPLAVEAHPGPAVVQRDHRSSRGLIGAGARCTGARPRARCGASPAARG